MQSYLKHMYPRLSSTCVLESHALISSCRCWRMRRDFARRIRPRRNEEAERRRDWMRTAGLVHPCWRKRRQQSPWVGGRESSCPSLVERLQGREEGEKQARKTRISLTVGFHECRLSLPCVEANARNMSRFTALSRTLEIFL
jgi:hypothetical protein